MYQRIRGVVLVAGLLLLGTASSAAGQLNSMPVFVSPKGGTGVTLALSYGRGLNGDSQKNTAFAARATLGLSAISIGAGIGTYNPRVGTTGRETEVQYMGHAAIRLLGGAFLPVAVNVHGGVGFYKQDTGIGVLRRTLNVPVGLGLALNLPASAFSIEPWVAPRVNVVRVDQQNSDDIQMGFGASAGINIGFANGLGAFAAYDWSDLGAASLFNPNDVLATQPSVFGIGLSHSFRLPSAPGF